MRIEEERELKSLIRRITEDALRRLLEPEKVEQGTLVLIPGYVTDKEPLIGYLKENHHGVTCAGQGAAALGEAFTIRSMETDQDRQQVMGDLKQYADIVLYSPPLWMLRNIAAGDDRGFIEQVFMRSLLWGKKTRLVLDYEKPRFKRGTFYEGIADALGAIEGMGAGIVSLKLSVGKPEGHLPLVTETEVTDAYKEGRKRIRCAEGAIVTPLAWDAAKELGIAIDT